MLYVLLFYRLRTTPLKIHLSLEGDISFSFVCLVQLHKTRNVLVIIAVFYFFVTFLNYISENVRELLDENQRCLNHLTSLLQGNAQEIEQNMMVHHIAFVFFSQKIKPVISV